MNILLSIYSALLQLIMFPVIAVILLFEAWVAVVSDLYRRISKCS